MSSSLSFSLVVVKVVSTTGVSQYTIIKRFSKRDFFFPKEKTQKRKCLGFYFKKKGEFAKASLEFSLDFKRETLSKLFGTCVVVGDDDDVGAEKGDKTTTKKKK